MPALHNVLIVLEYNFHKCSIRKSQNWRVQVQSSTIRSVRYAILLENSLNFEVVCELHGSVWCNKGHAIDSISLLAIDLTSWICHYDSSGSVDHSIVVWTLWIWPWSTCSKISPEMSTCNQSDVDSKNIPTWLCAIHSCILKGTALPIVVQPRE